MPDQHLFPVASRKESEFIGLLCQPPGREGDYLNYVGEVDAYLTHQLDLNMVGHESGLAPLHALALHIKKAELAQFLIPRLLAAGAKIDTLDATGDTSLHVAISAGNSAAVKVLLHQGASHQIRSTVTRLLPMEAAVDALRYPQPGVSVERSTAIITSLFEAGARVPAASPCLILAAGGNDHGAIGDFVDAIDVLVNAGASIDLTETRTGRQALHYAAMRGSWKTVVALLRAGSDVLATDQNGQVAFTYAEQSGSLGHEMRAVIRAAEMQHLIARQQGPAQEKTQFVG